MTTPSGITMTLNAGVPYTSDRNINITLKALGAWEMRLENNADPSGSWSDYDPLFLHTLPSGTGSHWVVAELRDDSSNSAPLVSGQITYSANYHGIPFGANISNSVYYRVKDIIEDAGYVDASGVLSGVALELGEIESYIKFEAPEDQYGVGTVDLSIELPAIIITQNNRTDIPAALGGDDWEQRFYQIEIFGNSREETDELAESIFDKIKAPINIYDYNLGFPDGNPSFPLPNQLIGAFPIRNPRSVKVILPSYDSLTEHRRRITFEIHNIRKSY